MDYCQIAFVILHYLTDDLTKKCIEYIKNNCDTESYHIVVVDNASPNNSYEILKEIFCSDNHVTLIHNEHNLGFARGNNVGIRYVVNECNAKYIVVLNNDVYLTEKHLFKKLEKEYLSSHFAVAGPKITDISDEGNANPHGTQIFTIEFCRFMIRRKRFDLICSRTNTYFLLQIVRKIIGKLNLYVFPKLPMNPFLVNSGGGDNNVYGCTLHGCCLIFSPLYLERYDGFDERTYMYCEENVLYLTLMKEKLKSVYMTNITVKHIGKVATNMALKNKEKRKRIFEFKHSIIGWKVCLDILQKYKIEHGHELYEEELQVEK